MKLLAGWLIVCAACAPAVVRAAELSEDSCSLLMAQNGQQPALQAVLGLEVLSLRPDRPLAVVAPDGVKVNAVVCWRSEARFAENDYLVAEAGFPFYVKTELEDETKDRTALLERVNGGFRIRLLSGPGWSKAEEDEMKQFIALYSTKFRERSDKPPPPAGQIGEPSQSALSPDAPPDRPHPIPREKWAAYDEAIAPHVAEARKTWPDARRRYLNGLPTGHVFFVTTRLRDSEGHWEQSFIRVHSIRDRTITGVIASHLVAVTGYQFNQSYSFDEAELLDWMVARPDGSEEGNVVGKFLDTYRP
jgi:hypothetical protein